MSLVNYHYTGNKWNAYAATGGKATGAKHEAIYDEPVDLKQYEFKGDGEVDLKDCPAYGKPNRQEDIELRECPAYMECKVDLDINLQECPAYGGPMRPPDVELEENPAFIDTANHCYDNYVS